MIFTFIITGRTRISSHLETRGKLFSLREVHRSLCHSLLKMPLSMCVSFTFDILRHSPKFFRSIDRLAFSQFTRMAGFQMIMQVIFNWLLSIIVLCNQLVRKPCNRRPQITSIFSSQIPLMFLNRSSFNKCASRGTWTLREVRAKSRSLLFHSGFCLTSYFCIRRIARCQFPEPFISKIIVIF